jgi:hypothetical protein
MNTASRQFHRSSKSWSASEPKSHRGVKVGNRSREFFLTFLLPLSQVIARRDTQRFVALVKEALLHWQNWLPKNLAFWKPPNLVSSSRNPQTSSRLLKIRKPRLVSSKSANILSSLQDGSDGGALIFVGFVLCLSVSWRAFLRTGRHPGWWSKSPKVPRRTDDFNIYVCVGEKKIEREKMETMAWCVFVVADLMALEIDRYTEKRFFA